MGSIQSQNDLKNAWRGAMILTVAGIITKILSAGYRIPFQNIVGDVGFYIYQQVYPFYGVALILSIYGFPVVISKLVAEQPLAERRAAIHKIMNVSFILLSFLGLLLFISLYVGAREIAILMGDVRLTSIIKVTSFTFLILPIVSTLRGAFQGENNMTPTAVSQVSEQFFRVLFIIGASYFLLVKGESLYTIGAGAMLGSVVGGIVALVLLLFLWRKYKRNEEGKEKTTLTTLEISKVLFIQGFTICISSLLLILLQMIDAFTIYAILIQTGIEEELAKQLKGSYDRGQPLIQLGTVVATAFSLSLVPLITIAKGKNDQQLIKDKVSLSIRVSILIGLGASFGLALLIGPINTMLFKNSFSSDVLFVLSFSILFSSIALTAAAILHGLNKPLLPAGFVLIGVGAKWIMNVGLVPVYGTLGAAFSTVLALAVVAFLLIMSVKKRTGVAIWNTSHVYTLGKAVILMTILLVAYMQVTSLLQWDGRLSATIIAFIGVFLGGAIYLVTILRSSFFQEKELSLLPLGNKITFLLKK
ncbi:putative polysaccharide biosynthesis protein [Bacillus sp. FJAT-45066]|uniref:putative polysaccharide biosynthesis protein n=1 Tax=Bacillus sp. FJAT-45066 TaxID=2011010 RepID=UPI000BB771C0|nr:polysaccharide biosynthesis protein [Bacillus sp. FJAT-45066]